MMKRLLILFAILTLGVGVGAGAALLYSGNLMANVLLELKRLELYRSSDGATEASKSQPPQVAIWALERHLELIDELRKIDYPRGFLDTEAIIAHARLAKLYEGLGKADEKRTHVRLAIDAAKSSDSAGLQMITSEERLALFLIGVDDPSQRDSTSWGSHGGQSLISD